MACDPRIVAAYNAMKSLGIPAETVRPVLKNLLKLYDKNWELIAEDNYRTLADAIFELAEDEHKEDAMNCNGSKSPPGQLITKQKDNEGIRKHKGSEAFSNEDKGLVSSDLPHKVMKSSIDRAPSNVSSIKARNGSGSEDRQRGKRKNDCHSDDILERSRKQPVNSDQQLALPGSKVRPGSNKEAPKIGNAKLVLIKNESRFSEPWGEKPQCLERKNSSDLIDDITKGSEKVKISLHGEIGKERPPNFVYMPQNTCYQDAYIPFSLARIADDDCCSSCSKDCLSAPVPCECARDTGGVFAYTPEGQLNEEFLRACISMHQEPQDHVHFYCDNCPLERAKNEAPGGCKGHLVRKFIKECWRKCGCDMQCGNRIVQRGISCKLQVFLTNDGKGWGLRTLQDLPRGAFVCEYVGEILTNMELYDRNSRSSGNDRHTYPVLLDADWGAEGGLKDEEALCLDATYYGNVARFINHRCFDANLIEVPVEVETPDHHYYHLAFFTTKEVKAFEELTWDYGIDFNDHNHPIKAFKCCCGSPSCRDPDGTRKEMEAPKASTSRGLGKQ